MGGLHDDDGDFGRLEAVSARRQEWAGLPLGAKIDLLRQIQAIMTEEMSYNDYLANARMGAAMMGLPVDGDVEGDFETASQALTYVIIIKKSVDDLLYCLQVGEGSVPPPKMLTKEGLKTRRATPRGGQVVVQTFPTIPGDATGLLGHCTGEVYLDPEFVKDESQVETFSFEKAWAPERADAAGGGLMVVLGAGNQPALTSVDVLNGLFVRGCVVYVKQHPIRGYVNDLIVRIFRPLVERRYLDVEGHSTYERSAALVHHPLVTAVHLTGGKATHDAIVWGPAAAGKPAKVRTVPLLKATMTSELGAVSPWIIVPARYTDAAMKSQARMLAHWVHNNASCNCNTPKCLVVAQDWEQRDEFLALVEASLTRHRLPVAYYPGIEQRWKGFATNYPDARRLESTSGLGVEERRLLAPPSSDKALLLPYLVISVDVDLSTPGGRAAARDEYAFRTEPFAPVYTVATLVGTQSDLASFCETAATFCNDYLYGTLSGSVTVAPEVSDDPAVQSLIADLRYGCLGVNTWGGGAYLAQSSGVWGAYPGERLEDVQSGRGTIGNFLGIPRIQKFVLTSPIVHRSHSSLKQDLRKEQQVLQAAAKYSLDGSVKNLLRLLSAVTGFDLFKVAVAGLGVVVAGVAYAVVGVRGR